jgi:hypothetical protein
MAAMRAALEQRLSGSHLGRLMLTLLHERESDFVNLALEAVGPFEGREEVALVRAALISGERQHIASAREILQHFRDRDLARRIDRLLGQEAGPEELDPHTAWSRLKQAAERSDEWFRTCVGRVAAELCDA